jgi:hypothetical protein
MREYENVVSDETVIKRFEAKFVDVGKCWLWRAGKDRDGYGTFQAFGRGHRAHRFSYRIYVGKLRKDLLVCHSCDNTSCVNPNHLFVGTQLDNKQDCIRKGRHSHGDKHWTRLFPEKLPRGDRHHSRIRPERMARGLRHGTKTQPERVARGSRHGFNFHPENWSRGEQVNTAKLTSNLVRKIRKEYASGKFSYNQLAVKYGVRGEAISALVRRKTWKHVK